MINSIHIDGTGLRSFSQVQKATIMANELLHNEEFYNRICQCPGFDLANVSPVTIAELLRATSINMHVALYYALSPVKNYDGYDDIDNPTMIHLNAWKIDRSPASICNTIIHSCIHALNARYNQFYFGHGDLSLEGKENTAPYKIGALAQEMVAKEDAMILPLEHDPYEHHVKESKKRDVSFPELLNNSIAQ